MRPLSWLWESGDIPEKQFVARLLLHMAHDQPVTDDTWRQAEKLWEKSVQDNIDLGRSWPEVRAIIFLTKLMSATCGS